MVTCLLSTYACDFSFSKLMAVLSKHGSHSLFEYIVTAAMYLLSAEAIKSVPMLRLWSCYTRANMQIF